MLLGFHDQTPVLDGPQHTSNDITKAVGAHSPIAHQAIPLMNTLGAQWGSEQPCSAQRTIEDIVLDASRAVAVGKFAATDTPGQGMIKLEMGGIGASNTKLPRNMSGASRPVHLAYLTGYSRIQVGLTEAPMQ